MAGSDFVAAGLMLVFGAGFIYFSFIFPARQKKENGVDTTESVNMEEEVMEAPTPKGKKAKNDRRKK